MWKKLRSNRDPRDTLLSELKKEFAPYVAAVVKRFTLLLDKYPKFSIGVMVFLLLASLTLSFTLFSHSDQPKKDVHAQTSIAAEAGFSRIMGITERISKSIELKKVADSLNRKKELNHADSVKLLHTLERLEHLLTH